MIEIYSFARWVDIRLITNMRQRNDWFQSLDLFGCMNDSLEVGLLKAVPGSGGGVSTSTSAWKTKHKVPTPAKG